MILNGDTELPGLYTYVYARTKHGWSCSHVCIKIHWNIREGCSYISKTERATGDRVGSTIIILHVTLMIVLILCKLWACRVVVHSVFIYSELTVDILLFSYKWAKSCSWSFYFYILSGYVVFRSFFIYLDGNMSILVLFLYTEMWACHVVVLSVFI